MEDPWYVARPRWCACLPPGHGLLRHEESPGEQRLRHRAFGAITLEGRPELTHFDCLADGADTQSVRSSMTDRKAGTVL